MHNQIMTVCPNCGTNVVDPTAQFCPSCGATLNAVSQPTMSSAPPPSQPAYGGYPPSGTSGMRGARPTGITILAILEVLGGLALLLGGAAITALGGLVGLGLGAAFGGILIIFGLLSFVVAFGLWTGKEWAWLVALILSGLGALFDLVSIVIGLGYGSILSLLIDVAIIYYLTRPHVRAYFGK